MAKLNASVHAGLWSPCRTNRTTVSALERAAEIGFSHIVVPLRPETELDVVRVGRECRERGLTPLNASALSAPCDIGSEEGSVREAGIARLTSIVQQAEAMGSIQVGGILYGPVGKAPAPASRDELNRSADALSLIAERAAASGIRLAIEIVNRYESNRVNTVRQACDLVARIAHPNVYLHLDTFHMIIEEADPYAAMRQAVDRLAYFELAQSQRGRLLEGSIDLERWSKFVAGLDYQGLVGIEAFSRRNLAEEHANALSIWRDTFTDGDAVAREGLALIKRCFAARDDTSQ